MDEDGEDAGEWSSELDSGEKYSWDLGIMGDADVIDSCPPAKEYQFNPTFGVQRAGQEEYAETWDGFVVEVNER